MVVQKENVFPLYSQDRYRWLSLFISLSSNGNVNKAILDTVLVQEPKRVKGARSTQIGRSRLLFTVAGLKVHSLHEYLNQIATILTVRLANFLWLIEV